MDEYRCLKKLNKKEEENPVKNIMFKFVSQVLLSSILLLVALIMCKNTSLKGKVYHYLYEDNLSFKEIETLYEKYLGFILPEGNKKTEQVASNKMGYIEKEDIEGGVRLTFGDEKLVTAIESGLVIFVGEKEGKPTIILEQTDGVEAWYVGITDTNFKIYDYIEKGEILGNVKENTLDLFFKKKGEVISYQNYSI